MVDEVSCEEEPVEVTAVEASDTEGQRATPGRASMAARMDEGIASYRVRDIG